MKQFYETYKDSQFLSALLRELSWTNNLLVMSRAKNDEERQFDAMRYERAAISETKSKNLPVKLEIGKDFTFVGEEFRVQVGNSDFYDDEVVEYALQRSLSPMSYLWQFTY